MKILEQLSQSPERHRHKIKKDKYSSARGGSSEFIDLYCGQCRHHVALYQKDGRGALFRLYNDRIVEPPAFIQTAAQSDRVDCPTCHTHIGTPMVYKKEHRPAIRLLKGAVVKQRSDGTFPPKTTHLLKK